MESEEALNIKAFKRLSNRHFLEGLDKAPSLLQPRQASLFYRTVLEHFNDSTISQENGDAILKCVAKTLCIEGNIKAFIDGDLASLLPYNIPRFHNGIFNVMYVIISTSPVLVDESISSRMPVLIKANPKKALTLIALYSQQFSEIDNPWPIVDLLIQEGQYFVTQDVATDYVTLLAFLNKKYVEYKNGRAQHCWNQVCSMLVSSDRATLRACYGGLCAIAAGYSEGPLPLEIVSAHIRLPEMQDAVLSMLNVATLSESDSSNKKLLTALLSAAETNVKAALVLMKLCCSFKAARTLLDIGGWISKSLPTPTDTLRIFLVILRHRDLREQIAASPDFVQFLLRVLELERGGMVPVACTIIRRVPLSKELVGALSKSGFLRAFYDAAEDDDEGLTQHSKLLLTDTICRVCYAKEYVVMCDKVSAIITGGGEFTDAASLVAVRLCKFPRCRQRMRELRLDAFFRKKRGDAKLGSIASKFLRTIAEEGDN